MIAQPIITANKTFLGLTDTPGAYSGTQGKVPGENAGGDALEFISHDGINGSGSNSHSQIDTHIASTSNPHSVTKTQVGLSNVTNLKDNLNSAADPTVTDDSNAGYAVGSYWINTTDDTGWVCVDATVGAAIWHTTTRSSISSGAEFPTTGLFIGKRFRLNAGDYSGNRDVTYEYSGSIWEPVSLNGATTYRVDLTDGTDSAEKGFAVDSDAFKTLTYAISQVPEQGSSAVTIILNAETYTESPDITGKEAAIKIQGTLVSQESATADSMTAGPLPSTNGTLTDTGAFTGDSWAEYLLHITDTDDYRIIKSHTNDVITIAGVFSSVPGSKGYTIYGFGTIINGLITVINDQHAVTLEFLQFSEAATIDVDVDKHSSVTIVNCSLLRETRINDNSSIVVQDSLLKGKSGSHRPLQVRQSSSCELDGCLLTETADFVALVSKNSFLGTVGGTNADTGADGYWLTDSRASLAGRCENFTGTGIFADGNSFVTGTAAMVFVNNGTDKNPAGVGDQSSID